MSRRQTQSSSSRTSSKSPSSKIPAELVTYRYEGEMVYVNPGSDYDEAITCALENFSSLEAAPRDHIAFFVKVRVGGALRSVRISRNAWSKVLTSLSTYEIIDISVLPRPSLRPAKSDTDVRSPNYEDSTDEKAFLRSQMYDAPPVYGDLSTMDGSSCTLEGRETKSSAFLQIPTSGPIKRASSALGWFGKRL